MAELRVVPSRFFLDAVVMQPTSLCNLDCGYCYLPHRRHNERMAREVVDRVVASIERFPPSERHLDIIWHSGEPLAAGRDHLENLFDAFEPMRRNGRIRHVLQTNATLIDADWCAFFKRFEVEVGLSIDGPARMSDQRVDWRGRSAHDRILRGIRQLREAGIDFGVIAVIGPREFDDPAAVYHFLADLGCAYVGFNVEQPIATTRGRTGLDDYAGVSRFWSGLTDAFMARPIVRVRELERFAEFIGQRRLAADPAVERVLRVRMYPGVNRKGDVSFLSPEFIDCDGGAYGSFVVGNVLEDYLGTIAGRAKRAAYVRDFLAGQDACAANCGHYDFCGGGSAVNKVAERGTARAEETVYCRMAEIELCLALDCSLSSLGDEGYADFVATVARAKMHPGAATPRHSLIS